ncbi:MAG: tetratricopeptide repeat protein [Parvularculaceae bacterium]
MQRVFLGALAAGLVCTQVDAMQMVTTFGTSDASQCFQNANSRYSTDVGPCDRALKSLLSSRDKKATLVNRGIIHRKSGDLQLALDDFNAALEIDPDLAEAYLNRGTVYFQAGQADAAIADYQKALDLGTSRPWAAWYNIGLAYEEKNDKAKALEAYAKALESNPSFAPAREKLAQLG